MQKLLASPIGQATARALGSILVACLFIVAAGLYAHTDARTLVGHCLEAGATILAPFVGFGGIDQIRKKLGLAIASDVTGTPTPPTQ